MNYRLKKIDVIIVVALIVIAGIVLFKIGYIDTTPEDDKRDAIPEELPAPPIKPPESFIPGYMRAVSPEDEGVHFDKLRISREWWYFNAVFDEESDLNGWTVAISFNHMARSDLLGTLKPDLLVVTLHGPNGEAYGGMINKKRGFGILNSPTLEATSPGVSVTYEDSWAEGKAPEWHVHAEDNEIDKDHEIIIDLDYFTTSEPLWTMGERAFDKSKSNIASYMFIGCNVTGVISIDGIEYYVRGSGYHEHSWSPRIVTRGSINGWDWCHMTLDNGWNIYFNSYYPTPQTITRKTSRINPFGTLVITTDHGRTLTQLNNIEPKIVKSDTKVFPFVTIPSEIRVTAKPSILQPLLKPYDIQLDINIVADNTYEKVWKFPTYVGMKVGRSTITGTMQWSDDDGDHEIEVNGIGTFWSMSALF